MEDWVAAEGLHFKNARWETALRGALVRRRGGHMEVAVPFSPQHPFPLPELMCFARLEKFGAENRIIYVFDAQKTPIF